MIAFSGFAILGGAICTLAPNMNWLFLGQTLIGIGCAPAFMAAIVFTSKHWPAARFAGISGLVLALSGGGMLLWRSGFVVLTAMSLVTLLASAMAPRKNRRQPFPESRNGGPVGLLRSPICLIRAPSDRASRTRICHVWRPDHDQRSVDRANVR